MFWEASFFIRNPGRASEYIYQKIASPAMGYSKACLKRMNAPFPITRLNTWGIAASPKARVWKDSYCVLDKLCLF
jgi:hypothetical protein